VLGFLKEIVMDHSLDGYKLADNIVVVAACNPSRSQIQTTTRERDLGKAWASGHYQVSELPMSMKKLKWSFGALSHSQEKEFIYRRMEVLHGKSMPSFLRAALTEVVSASHEIMRTFAKRNIQGSILKHQKTQSMNIDAIEVEAIERARSIVSLRDIQRVFSLYSFFFDDMTDLLYESDLERSAMLLSIAVVYYFRLDTASRGEFLRAIDELPTEAGQQLKLLQILNNAMDFVVHTTEIPLGIAVTRGLKENIFAALVCAVSQTPLVIVGPPGSSKTLAVHIVGDNATGSDSVSRFYKTRPRLSLFHYQCSKQSTSKEISTVFDQATQRQERSDAAKSRCVVFMDEAGLPEEEKESLKVLHYLLESHMSAKAKVGFVAISNHVLDAAKTNRCVMLLRQDPDDEEMIAIANGVLFDYRKDGQSCAHDVDIDGDLISVKCFAESLCLSYASLFVETGPLTALNTFFGLRDFIYLLKAIRSSSRMKSTRLCTSIQTIIYSIERNFNGVTDTELRQIVACFLKPLAKLVPVECSSLESCFRNPMKVLKDAVNDSLQPNQLNQSNRPRFKLVIDCTEDDSILRLLSSGGVLEVTQRSLYKLSNLPDDVDLERLRLVSGVKFAAMQGNFAILSQTEPVNESFYDLFNQRFHEIASADGKTRLYANIAVGGISRRSLVQPKFECIIHVRESNMLEIPAPFLNRFEKYRLTLNDVLVTSWSKFRGVAIIVAEAKLRASKIVAAFHKENDLLCWLDNPQTLESIFIDMLPHLDYRIWNFDDDDSAEGCKIDSNGVVESVVAFLENFTSLRQISYHVSECVQLARIVLPTYFVEFLDLLMQGENSQDYGEALQSSFGSIFSPNMDTTNKMVKLLSILMQMSLTRIALFRLIQLCTPESIFTNR
jgi:hypothetical protein